jgi:iron complex outermembrane receptor protein
VRWGRAAWSGRVGVERHGPQHRVPDGHQAVEGYTLWSASLALRSRLDGHPVLWYLRLDNATDTLAYSATSILTQTAPGKVPLSGRSLKAGLQLSF